MQLASWKLIIFAMVVLAQGLNMFHRTSLAALSDQMFVDLSLTAVQFGNLASIYFFLYAGMQFLAGGLGDTLGSRRVVTWGCLLSALGSLLLGLAGTVGWAYAARLLVGLGVSVIYVNGLRLVRNWFPPGQYATALGLVTGLGTLGSVFSATPLAFLGAQVGWRWALALVGLLSTGVALLFWLLVRDYPAERTSPAGPREPVDQAGAGASQLSLREVWPLLRLVMNNRRSWPCFAVGLGLYSTQMIFAATWSIPYLMQVYGLGAPQAANFAILTTMGMMVGQAGSGYLSDRILASRRGLLIAGSAGSLTLWLVLAVWGGGVLPLAALYPLCLLAGLLCSPAVVVYATVVAENPARAAGAALGFANGGFFVGTALLGPLFGWVLDCFWQGAKQAGGRLYPPAAFQAAFLVMAAFALVALVASLLTRETLDRRQ